MYFVGSGTKTDKKKTNPRQGTDWTSANLLCFPVCFSNKILVRMIGRNDEKTRRWMIEFYFYTRENLRYQQGNPAPAHQAWKGLVKRSGHVVNHVVRRTGLWTSTASAVPRDVLFQKVRAFPRGKVLSSLAFLNSSPSCMAGRGWNLSEITKINLCLMVGFAGNTPMEQDLLAMPLWPDGEIQGSCVCAHNAASHIASKVLVRVLQFVHRVNTKMLETDQ